MPDFDIIIPRAATLRAARGRLTTYARERVYWLANRQGRTENDLRKMLGLEPLKRGDRIIPKMAGGAGSFTDYGEALMLDLAFHDGTALSADPYMGLWTSTLQDNSTGATAGEMVNPTAYNNYQRAQILNASMNAAVQGTPSSKTNGTAITFQACTANSAIAQYWGVCDAQSNNASTGNMIIWGSCTNTTIDSSHTPPTVAAGALSCTLD